jgi:type III pantothenate kinase
MKTPKILLIDCGNTNTDFALATPTRLCKVVSVPTHTIRALPFKASEYQDAIVASVVPVATKVICRLLAVEPIMVESKTPLGIGIQYPNPGQIGADRLANAVGVVRLYGAPSIVVDFGTAVTFDIVNARRQYIGGVIAPGISAMTDYLHEHTALLPHITPREPRSAVGKSTIAAMQVGTVIGYRGLVKEIIGALRQEPGMKRAQVVATGGYGALIARKVPAIQHVNPLLTLEGLRFIYLHNAHQSN